MSEAVPLASQIACVQRELRMRQRVYPRWVEAGKMTAVRAENETRAMQAVLETLRGLLPPDLFGPPEREDVA